MEKYIANRPIFQYKMIDPKEIPFSQSVVEACRENRCGKYGTCWTCPPGVGNINDLQKRITNYKECLIFTCKHTLEDSFDFEGMREAGKTTQKLLLDILKDVKNDGVDYMAMGCEGCIICEKCTYPDAPCRFPEKAIPSIEACGISVVDLARNIGINYNNGPCTVTYFCAILRK